MTSLLRATLVLTAAALLAPALASAFPWSNEQDLLNEPPGPPRSTYIYDPGRFN
jgi:hypothetical protein